MPAAATREPAPPRAPREGLVLAAALVHAALFLWAAGAWIGGPFRGEGVVDGAEVLQLATTGSAGAFETKSPLYPWLLGLALRLPLGAARTVALLGLGASLAALFASAGLARRLAGPRAAALAAWAWALSGSVLALGVQPLPAVAATALLAQGALLGERARGATASARGTSAAAGLLLGLAVLARAALLPASLLLLALCARRRPFALAGAGAALLLGLALFGPRAWPAAGALNLRIGNEPGLYGPPVLRPGPAYDELRFEAFAAQPADAPLGPPDERQLALLAAAVRADPGGFAFVLARKLWIFWRGAELVASADFRHGLRDLPLAPLLLRAHYVVAPLGLVALLARRRAHLLLAVGGVLLANLVFVGSARYRLPALPFLCAAAAELVAARPRRTELAAAGALFLALLPEPPGPPAVVPGDGAVQEGYLRLAEDRLAPAARAALERAVAVGADPRARYLLALHHEARWQAGGRRDPAALAAALARYREAVALEPRYAEAAENLVRLLLIAGRTEEASAAARAALPAAPRAGLVRLNLAALLSQTGGDPAERAALEAEGHGIMALRYASQNEPARAREHARAAVAAGSTDARVAAIAAGAPIPGTTESP